jgi:hypothetical protein
MPTFAPGAYSKDFAFALRLKSRTIQNRRRAPYRNKNDFFARFRGFAIDNGAVADSAAFRQKFSPRRFGSTSCLRLKKPKNPFQSITSGGLL